MNVGSRLGEDSAPCGRLGRVSGEAEDDGRPGTSGGRRKGGSARLRSWGRADVVAQTPPESL
jgi:hypothetical protein